MIIGHAEVIVSPITRGFDKALRRDLKSIGGMIGRGAGGSLGDNFSQGFTGATGNIFNKLAGGFENIQVEALAAKEKFQSLVRTGYVLQGIIGPLVGGISSLVVSLGSLVGVLGKAAPAVAVLANGFVLLRVAMMTAKFGFGDIASAVKKATKPSDALGKSLAELREEFQQLMFQAEEATQSESRAALNLEDALNNLRRTQDLPPNSRARREALLAYEEAELAYRRAKDRAADLNDEVGKGQDAFIKKNKKAAGSDPFAGLNSAQREFAEYLVGLTPLLKDLELAVSKAFLPPLREAVEILVKDMYPILRRELPKVAQQTGEAIRGIVDGIDEGRVERILKGFTEPFGEGGQSNIQLFGDLINNVLDIFLQIVEATGPLFNDFLTFLVDKTQQWSDTLEGMDLEKYFGEAGEYAGGLGEVIGNLFKGLGNLIGLTTGPGSAGEGLLDWLKDSSAGFANMYSEDPEAGKKFFADAMTNTRSVMSSIGALISEILKLADKPEIAETFDKLKEGAPALGELLGKLVDAGPSFANFVVALTEISNQLTDSNQIAAFFDTLTIAANGFKDFLSTDLAKKFFDNLGPIFATFSAISVIFDVIKFAFLVIVGYFASMFIFKKKIMPLFTGMSDSLGKMKGLGPIFTKLGGGGLLIVFTLLITKAIEFYNKIEGFKQMVDNVIGEIAISFGGLWDELKRTFDLLFGGEGGGGLFSVLDPIIQVILEILIPALGFLVSVFIDTVTMVLSWVNNLIEGVIPGFTEIIDGIFLLFSDFPAGIEKIFGGIGTLLGGIMQFIVNSIIDLLNFGIKAINHLIGMATGSEFGQWLADVLGVSIAGVKLPEIQHVDMLSGGPLPGDVQAAGGADRAMISRFNNSAAYSNFQSQRQQTMATQSGAGLSPDASTRGITINVNGTGQDPVETAKVVERVLADGMQRGKY